MIFPRSAPAAAARRGGFLVALLLLAQAAYGGDADWHGRIGIAGLRAPEYLGADDDRNRGLPLIDLRHGERLYLGNSRFMLGGGVGWRLAHSQGWSWGVELLATPGRDVEDAAALAGMDDRDVGAFAATGLGYRHGIFRAALGLGAGLKDDAGLLALVSAGIEHGVTERLGAGFSLVAVLADAENMAYDYGVTDAEGARRQALLAAGDTRLRPGEAGPYRPGGGFKELGVRLRLGYALTPRWEAGFFAGWAQLQGAAADSPLARRRSDVAWGVSLARRLH